MKFISVFELFILPGNNKLIPLEIRFKNKLYKEVFKIFLFRKVIHFKLYVYY